jgi:LacI family transcriptional regulator
LSLAGFDGMPIIDLLGPPLTSIAQPIDDLGRLGAQRLIEMLDGRSEVPNTIRLPVALVPRSSVGAPKQRIGSATATPIHRKAGMFPQSINKGE